MNIPIQQNINEFIERGIQKTAELSLKYTIDEIHGEIMDEEWAWLFQLIDFIEELQNPRMKWEHKDIYRFIDWFIIEYGMNDLRYDIETMYQYEEVVPIVNVGINYYTLPTGTGDVQVTSGVPFVKKNPTEIEADYGY